MKSFVLVSLLVAVALAAPQGPAPSEPIPILQDENHVNGDGSYAFAYKTGNGISADEKGELKKVGDVDAISVQGEFQYPGENGEIISVSYIANENGFQPSGAHLPTAPPVPEEIQKALAFLASAPPQPEEAQ